MKRITALLIIVFMVTSLTTVAVGAYNVGDVIGYAQPTDIIATINGYQLKSYNVEGYTYIVAEDLRYYGMKVVYDDSTRTLGVYKDEAVTGINPPMTNANYWELGAPSTKKNILYTDIVTYVADNYVTSYNIDGATIIRFDELFRFGEVIYDNEKREISLAIEGLNANPVDVFLDYNAANFSKNMLVPLQKDIRRRILSFDKLSYRILNIKCKRLYPIAFNGKDKVEVTATWNKEFKHITVFVFKRRIHLPQIEI